jgi:hypothetical protein
VQDAVPAQLHLGGVNGDGAARINHDHATGRVRLVRHLGLLLFEGDAAHVRDPVIEEIVGLGLQRVRADRDDCIGELRVLVAVVELAHAHVARSVHFGVVGRPVVDPDVLDLHAIALAKSSATSFDCITGLWA